MDYHLPLQELLLSSYVLLSSLLQDLQEEKNERKKKKELNYTNGRKPILKTLSPSVLKNLRYLYAKGALGKHHGAIS